MANLSDVTDHLTDAAATLAAKVATGAEGGAGDHDQAALKHRHDIADAIVKLRQAELGRFPGTSA